MGDSVFISSTYRDLVAHRACLRHALVTAGFKTLDMEHFGSRPNDAQHASLGEVAAADILIGVYGHRYGFVPDGGAISITEMELDYAEQLGKPVLCFMVADDHHWSEDFSGTEAMASQLAEFRRRIEKRYVVSRFTTPDSLGSAVLASLFRWRRERDAPLDQASAQYELISPSAFGSRPPDLRPGIPSVLVHVVDRMQQAQGLREALERHVRAKEQSKPFVFVVLGSSDDAQEGLVQMYREDILPAFIASKRAVPRNQYAPVLWPPSGYTIENLRRDLATAVFLPPGTSDDDIRQRLTSGIGAYSLAYFIDSAEWTPSDSDLLLRWLGYWDAFPPGAVGRVVSVFICLQYSRSPWQITRRLRIESFYRTVQQIFKAGSNIVCLPRLSPINRAQAVQWANTAVPSRSRRFNSTLLKQEATRPFGLVKRRIPLDALAPTLRSALQLSQVTHGFGPPPWIQ